MITEVKVPSVGESVTSGVVSAWHKKSGEFVNEGEPLFALETDKVSTDIVAQKSGVLETKVPEGQEVKIGEVVAVIDDSKQRAEDRKEERPKKQSDEKRKTESESKKKTASVAAGADPGCSSLAGSSPHCGRKETRTGENSRHRRRRTPNKRRCIGCGRTGRQSRICRESC
jgi:2-oxoglutarate dehydrogenase E2 component (dihydrolipoamide succinyltransferase)